MRHQIWRKLVSLTLAFALVLGMIPAIPGAVDVALADTVIDVVEVTGLDLPEAGKQPDLDCNIVTPGVTQTLLDWSHNGSTMKEQDTFVAGETYQLDLWMVSDWQSGYYCKMENGYNVTEVTINGIPYKQIEAESNVSIIVEYEFYVPFTTIETVSVVGIDEPVAGANPDFAAVPTTAGYDITGVTWWDVTTLPAVEMSNEDVFEGGHQYRVDVDVEAQQNYVLSYDSADYNIHDYTATVNGKNASLFGSCHGDAAGFYYTFPALEVPKTTITSIRFSHDTDIKDHQAVGEVKVSEINGIPYEGPEVVADVNWYRSTDNFSNISEQGVVAWSGTALDGGYAYGLRIEMPDLDGYVYPQSFAVSLKTPSTVYHSEQLDANGVCYFFWNKLAHIPQMEYVNITMDGFYVGENITQLTFTSDEEIALDGGYGPTKRYTIKQLNANQDYEVLSNTTFQANKDYYLCYYLESASDLEGLSLSNVKLNGKVAIEKGVENGRTYYLFSLGRLSEGEFIKTQVTSIVVTLPKDKPVAGDALYYPTVVSVNGNTNLSDVVNVDNVKWYQNDFHVPEEVDYGPADSEFVQGKSYILWMSLKLAEEYKMADTYTLTVQTPSGNLEGVLDSDGESYVTYKYYFNLGAPTELPMMSSYAMELSGYQAGKEMKETTVELKCNGISVPKEAIKYGLFYVFTDQNQNPVADTFAYDTQYYMGVLVVPYNCKIDGLNEAQIKSMVTLHGMHPETVTAVKPGEQILGWEAYFKLPILRNTEALKSSSVTLSGTSYTYSGKTITPTVTVKNANGTKLTKGTDYTVAYKNNVNAGTATVTVKGIGNYSGTITKNFTIKRRSISSAALSYTKTTYSGSVKKPTVTVKNSSGTKLTKDTHYTVTYASGRTKVGRYKVTITGKGNYTGTITKYFTIVPKAPSSASAKLYGHDDVKFSWSKSTGASGYTVYYKKSTSSSYTYLTRTTGTSVKKAGLSDGVKYTFKVVPYYKSGDTRYASTAYKTASIYTLKEMAKPTAAKSGTKVKISWKKINGATGYQVAQYKKQSGKYVKVDSYYTTGSYKLFTAAKGATRYYQVRAYKTVDGKKIFGPWSAKREYKRK